MKKQTWLWITGGSTIILLIVIVIIASIIIPQSPTPATTAPFVITTMTHMEGDFKDDQNQNIFNKRVENMRWAMDLFDEYGAKLTFETEKSFATANTKWGLNILKEVISRGHGVGSHADFGAKPGTSLTDMTEQFKQLKSLIDNLVGAANNLGVSGGTGPTDWVTSAAAAGYKYRDAVTGFGYLSMPASARPSGWTNSYIVQTAYHDPIPPNLMDRIYPIPLQDAKDLVADPGAPTIMMGGDIGELASLAEGRSNCFPNCTFDSSDITIVTNSIDQIIAGRDTARFAKINIHIPMELLAPTNETLLRTMLSAIKEYTDGAKLSWDTQLGAYQQYINLEK